VPGEDGATLFISAGTNEVAGTVVANVAVGGTSHKGGTMVYSNTLQAYIVTIDPPGLVAGSSTNGDISITTTTGLDTGPTDFYRAYIPASITQTLDINSIDNNLQVTVVNTDTFPAEAYVVVVPSYGLPGLPPPGHRLVGSTYSVRASGALPATNQPMNLRLYYNNATLADADPHTLAIFAWDANPNNPHWDNLGGTLFTSPQKYVSVATSRFTTYALMTTPTWRDEFDDFSGINFTQFNDVTWTPGSLVLVSTATSGSAVSLPITPTTPITHWGSLAFSCTVAPPTTTLTVDILSLNGTEVLTDVTSGTNLAAIDPTQYPSLRLRVNMASTAAGETPALERWELGWQMGESEAPEQNKVYLPVVLK
jgi:hypothetical protein